MTFIITIPIWDYEGRLYMKETYNNDLEKQNIDYGELEIINEIKQNKFFKHIKMIPKEEFTYIDHNFELYKNKTIQNTYVILLSNYNVSVLLRRSGHNQNLHEYAKTQPCRSLFLDLSHFKSSRV